jgi:hypothetical protein
MHLRQAFKRPLLRQQRRDGEAHAAGATFGAGIAAAAARDINRIDRDHPESPVPMIIDVISSARHDGNRTIRRA